MSGIVLRPAAPATPADLLEARERYTLLRAELDRVRAVATAWRNGLGGLLVAIVGFSVIKGRSDIGQLDHEWAKAAGGLLLAALLCGTCSALLFVRAASGATRPTPMSLARTPMVADREEARKSRTAITRGITTAIACGAFLINAVAVTWYGPPNKQPGLELTTSGGTTFCGNPKKVDRGEITLTTNAGEVTLNLADTLTLRAVADCAPR
ncbi:hypothetical protein [Nocardia fluminea]|uniref:Uncharacterized protein n=1 Tax=Nocardia fluminea TaxID=134984 RepID=A0A2N3WYD1_9NOCA|nr:hypothetical protein [Nocardia fluminea]PKV98883.1 hypothetical protein ATK86_0913 [Nocardia fluminea]